MAIDVNRLSPWAQKQVLDKYRAELARRGDKSPKSAARTAPLDDPRGAKIGKYHNTPTTRITADGKEIRFDSQKEARRYEELMLLLKAGSIHELKLQPEWTLQEAYTTPEGNRVRAIRYRADFSYNTGNGIVVEDVKSKATKTRVYAIKKKLMLEKFGIQISEIE